MQRVHGDLDMHCMLMRIVDQLTNVHSERLSFQCTAVLSFAFLV